MIKLRMTDDMRKLQKWVDRHPEGEVSVIDISNDIHSPRHALVKSFKYLQRKFLEFYDDQEAAGRLRGNPTQKWMTATINFHRNFGVYPWIYDRERHEWLMAAQFVEYQIVGFQRVRHWLKSGQTVNRELSRVHAEFLPSGKRPEELLSDLKLLEEKLTDGPRVPRCPTCSDNIEPTWLACPTCGQPLTVGN